MCRTSHGEHGFFSHATAILILADMYGRRATQGDTARCYDGEHTNSRSGARITKRPLFFRQATINEYVLQVGIDGWKTDMT